MQRLTQRRRNLVYFAIGGSAALVALIAAVSPTGGVAGQTPLPRPALAAMVAMKDPSLRVSQTPQVVSRLSADMRAEPGTVRQLVTGLGKSKLTVWMWPHGSADAVCLVSTTGGGGCLDAFRGPFDISITDHDRLGTGDPVAVWGPVTDDVVGVDVTANGQTGQAIIKNNIAFYELPDASILPSAVEKVVVHLLDGTSVDVRV